MTAEPASVVVGRAAGAVRRRVGATAWVVLESVVAHASCHDGVPTASVSVRSLAAELGLGKNTVARALGLLRDIGAVAPQQDRVSTGTFAAGCYVVNVEPDVLAVVASIAPALPRAASASRRASRAASVPVEQLVLLPE